MKAMLTKSKIWGAAILAVLSVGLMGCNSTSKQTLSYDSKDTSYWGADGTRQPGPAPVAAKPAPAPAPAAAPGQVCSNLYYPTGDKASSAVWLQKCLPSEVSVGEVFTSEIKVTNLTTLALTDVVVTDQLPEGYELASTDPVTESAAGGKLQWRFSKLEPLSTKTIKVMGKATTVGTLANCATVSYNTVLCVETKVVQPALVLAKTLTPSALACDPIVMTIKVTNSGTGTARDVKISDNLPEGLTTKDGAKTWTQDVGVLAAGASKDYTVELKATGPGKFENTATASAAGNLTAEAKASTTVTKPVLTIVQDCPKRSFLGRDFCNDVTVTNTGDGVAKDVTVLVTMPADVAFVSATDNGTAAGNQVSWKIGELAPGASKKVTVCSKPAKEGTYKLAAAASGFCADAVASTCETVVEGIPAILLEVIDINDPTELGKNETYVITATNQGSKDATNVKIVMTIDEEGEFVNADGSATKGTAAGQVVTFETLAAIPVGGKATWKVVVKAVKEGDARQLVTMNLAEFERPIEETESSNFYK